MAVKAQRDYYKVTTAGDALEARIAALAAAVPKGSTVVDIGCNDGSISNALIEAGAAAKSFCFDLEDILVHKRPEIVFQTMDVKHQELSRLPDADGALILNVLHHIVAFSPKRAKEIVDALLARYAFVIADMGSFTEQGDWYWRRAFDREWRSDAEMWDFLFQGAAWRFKLLNYPSLGKGRRTLLKLYRQPYALDGLETVETFKRTPGARPAAKTLIPISEVGGTPVADSVEFRLSRSRRNDMFWVKTYLGPARAQRAWLENELGTHAAREARAIEDQAPCAIRAAVSVSFDPEGALVWPFEPDLFAGEIVHFQNWHEFLTAPQCKTAGVLATRKIEILPELPKVMLMHACDFQVCAGWGGLSALDFEPTAWLMRVRARGLGAKPGGRT
ncbi:MAG: hypothetical protein JOZ13_13560 [Alphaproteobacteria bacterium]|nr:hypothetical protein [Alphaproteobacteria bacterium]